MVTTTTLTATAMVTAMTNMSITLLRATIIAMPSTEIII